MVKNVWRDGMLGLITGDALGNPVQFLKREVIRSWGPVETMESGGAYKTPAGTWTDDSSMALATMDSLLLCGEADPDDLMTRFMAWYYNGKYTPFGKSFDKGATCSRAIVAFSKSHNSATCGCTGEHSNGNGGLMRILPACIFCTLQGIDPASAKQTVYMITGLTHNHLRAKMASGLYYHLVRRIILDDGELNDLLAMGLRDWEQSLSGAEEEAEGIHFERTEEILLGTRQFSEDEIRSTGYVIDSLEAACWALTTTSSLKECLLAAVNLGDDADSVGAIAGGLAGLYYGADSIPKDWLSVIKRLDWIERMCEEGRKRYTA